MAPGQGGTRNTPWILGPTFPPSRSSLPAPFYTYLRAVSFSSRPSCTRLISPSPTLAQSSSIVYLMTGELVLRKNRERSPSVPLRDSPTEFRILITGSWSRRMCISHLRACLAGVSRGIHLCTRAQRDHSVVIFHSTRRSAFRSPWRESRLFECPVIPQAFFSGLVGVLVGNPFVATGFREPVK